MKSPRYTKRHYEDIAEVLHVHQPKTPQQEILWRKIQQELNGLFERDNR